MDYIDLFCVKPNDHQVVSFFRMMFSDHIQAMQFEQTEKFNQMTDQEILDFYNHNLKGKENTQYGVWCAIEDRIVGMIGINRFKDKYRTHIGEIGFGVDADFVRKGIGTELIRKAEKQAQANGILRLECSCLGINDPAIALLKSMRFVIEGVKQKAILKDNHYHDQVLLGKLLT